MSKLLFMKFTKFYIGKEYITFSYTNSSENEVMSSIKISQLTQSVERRGFGRKGEVVGWNLPAILEVTLDGHSSGSLTIPRCKIGTRSRHGNSELSLRIIMRK